MKAFYPPQTNDFSLHKDALRNKLGIDVDECPFVGGIMARRFELYDQGRDAKYSKPTTKTGQLQFAPPPGGPGRKEEWQKTVLNAAILWVHPILKSSPIALAIIECLCKLDYWLDDEEWSADEHLNFAIQARRDRAANTAGKCIKKASDMLSDATTAGPIAHILRAIDADAFDSLLETRMRPGGNKGTLASVTISTPKSTA